MTEEEVRATQAAQRRYNRIAPLYDFMEGLVERSRYSRWREMLWGKVDGSRILEVGVGTGKNFPYYPQDAEITAIDFSEKMLKRARAKAEKQKVKVRLEQMDVQQLDFDDDSFDTVVGTFVFCSVPDPVRGLKEVRRVCRPGGRVLLLEHVLSANRLLAWLMNLANPLVASLIGPNINRRTVENVAKSGLKVEQVTDLAAGIFKLIEARKV
ncbi:MAG TPA: methyltransferase domain-containing protein [Dehalococcoidia bacterium]|jgi:ubiquinone/menaquinone biosynthesis C-methylase UbiE|nr:methyltransferase domain-containing protein [Dehalococcoidia bacterium]